MILRDMGATILITLLVAVGIGIGAKYITKSEDSHIEEASEEIIENIIEDALNLPDGALHGKIDFSINSPEND